MNDLANDMKKSFTHPPNPFKFQTGDELKSKNNPAVIAIIGNLGEGPDGHFAYQLYFHKSDHSGKFFLIDEVHKHFQLSRSSTQRSS